MQSQMMKDNLQARAEGTNSTCGQAEQCYMVEESDPTVQKIAAESGVHPGFILGITEFYSKRSAGLDAAGDLLPAEILRRVKTAAFAYNDWDDDDDELQTLDLRAWAARSVRLSMRAPWDQSLGNPYRTRWAEVNGRYFRVAAETLDTPWLVDEVTAAGEWLDMVPDGVTFRLSDARMAIAREAALGTREGR
ncbi:hypothetical protein SEA_AOKA_28 [Arthrobacter phage Aoka]|nr:hypothetical protein SEA_AOKA_28 [Arthrobacter phage Aoka]